MCTLEDVSSVANSVLLIMKSLNKTVILIFYLLCVLRFQRQPFRFSFSWFSLVAF